MLAACRALSTEPGPFVGAPYSVIQIFLAASPFATIVRRAFSMRLQLRCPASSDGSSGYVYGWELPPSQWGLAPARYGAARYSSPPSTPSPVPPPRPPVSTSAWGSAAFTRGYVS